MTTAELFSSILDIVRPAQQVVASITMKPSTRTYYLGANGRVSQRKQLVGEVIATVRAYTTDHARYKFADYSARRNYPVGTPRPYIGKPVLCKCGWFHGHLNECPVCHNWASIGHVQTAPTVYEVVR